MKRLALIFIFAPLLGFTQVMEDPGNWDDYYYLDDYSIVEQVIVPGRFLVPEYREVKITVDNLTWVMGMREPGINGVGWVTVLTPTGHLLDDAQTMAFMKQHNVCYPWH